jgi:hypothetical protein
MFRYQSEGCPSLPELGDIKYMLHQRWERMFSRNPSDTITVCVNLNGANSSQNFSFLLLTFHLHLLLLLLLLLFLSTPWYIDLHLTMLCEGGKEGGKMQSRQKCEMSTTMRSNLILLFVSGTHVHLPTTTWKQTTKKMYFSTFFLLFFRNAYSSEQVFMCHDQFCDGSARIV